MRLIVLSACALATASLAMATGAAHKAGCHRKLDDIRSGKLSADDGEIISKCIVNGYVTDQDVARAYDRATKTKGKP